MPKAIATRLFGLLTIAIGVAVAWFFLLEPLRQAQAGVSEVRYELRAFVLVPLCIVFGLAFLVRGPGLDYRTADHKNLTATGWVLFALVAVLTAAGWYWFDQQFTALGYQ